MNRPYYNDDGSEISPDLIAKPDLCISCKKDELGGEEEILCILNRVNQGKEPFCCEDYKAKE